MPGEYVRVRLGDIIPADVKLLAGTLSLDGSALTGESKDVDEASGDVLSSGSVVRRGEGDGAVAHRSENFLRAHHSISPGSTPYAIPAGIRDGKPVLSLGEWIMHNAKILVAQYKGLAAKFNPTKFDADAWVALAN